MARVKGIIHSVEASTAISCSVNQYDRLFLTEEPGQADLISLIGTVDGAACGRLFDVRDTKLSTNNASVLFRSYDVLFASSQLLWRRAPHSEY
jgi:hypothetical protein